MKKKKAIPHQVDAVVMQLREQIAEVEHEQWEYWSMTMKARFKNWIRESKTLEDLQGKLQEQIENWSPNWRSYNSLSEEIKDFDRKWADKVIILFDTSKNEEFSA